MNVSVTFNLPELLKVPVSVAAIVFFLNINNYFLVGDVLC